ncbi:hypothetical protein EIL87_01260 [Saccharopolyspora rhizosphaerae]|uniref:Uncharacterized protein n=1 Tax=Saccharopolyspora rhizosphaerae TaxID=2492662 RepID=A0A3R8PB73_9PSEU|nr:DUF6518 family protein [Saccharopolyspora rhizosphaerae]RRO20545.1 hypothetical protein EIL87_01260 [Saccharopolyspora rhizosphaerae]
MTELVGDAVLTGAHRRRGATGPVVLAVAAGLAAGAATSVAQGVLPEQVASLANSSGSWCLLAFLLALTAPSAPAGAVCGFASLACMLAGYVLTAWLHGYPSSTGMVVFWSAAALLAGPVLGVGAQWLLRKPGPHAALGISSLCGVLIGEAAYGLLVVAESTEPRYWWSEGVFGVVLLVAAAVWKLRGLGVILQAVLVTAAVASAFPVMYLHGGVLMRLLP